MPLRRQFWFELFLVNLSLQTLETLETKDMKETIRNGQNSCQLVLTAGITMQKDITMQQNQSVIKKYIRNACKIEKQLNNDRLVAIHCSRGMQQGEMHTNLFHHPSKYKIIFIFNSNKLNNVTTSSHLIETKHAAHFDANITFQHGCIVYHMQIKGMSFWRISSIFTLFTYRIQLDTCFDIQIHLSLRLGTFYNSYCFFSSLHVSIIFIIAIYHYTTLALTHSVHTPRNITSGHVRLVLHKV